MAYNRDNAAAPPVEAASTAMERAMYAFKSDLLCEFGERTDKRATRQKTRPKSTLDRLVGHMALGQIFGDQLLYEIHGPFVPPQCRPVRCPIITRLLKALSGRLCGIACRIPMRRGAYASSGLDDAMLNDIGITRAEMEFAIGRIDQRS